MISTTPPQKNKIKITPIIWLDLIKSSFYRQACFSFVVFDQGKNETKSSIIDLIRLTRCLFLLCEETGCNCTG